MQCCDYVSVSTRKGCDLILDLKGTKQVGAGIAALGDCASGHCQKDCTGWR